jgi:hypothetical protein
VRAPARKPRWLNPAPCTAAKGMYLVGARKQELPGATLLGTLWMWPGSGTAVNMRGRFYGLVECLIYQAPNAAARVASAANSPLPNATGGPKRPRRTRGFPMWHFLRSIPALAETRGRTRGNFRAPDAKQNSRAEIGRPDPRRCRAVVSRRSARLQLTRQPSDGGRDFRGRDASYLAPPAQIRTGPIRAYGSHLGCLTAKRLAGHG